MADETPTQNPPVTVVEDALFDLGAAGQTPTARPPKPRPVTAEVTAILDVLRTKPELVDDRRKVVTAIVLEARAHAGKVNPNRVRTRLADASSGRPDVTCPQVVGAVYAALRHQGVLEFDGYVTSTDKASGNSGRPARAYRLVRIPEPRDAAA